MALNNVNMIGRIPFDITGGGEEGKEYTLFTMSVARDYKPEGEQYYPEDLITCKAFRGTAKFISQYFKKGDHIVIQGQLRRDNDYEKDGQQMKGQMFVNVEKAFFVPKASGNEETAAATVTKAGTPAAKPGLPKKGLSAPKSGFPKKTF